MISTFQICIPGGSEGSLLKNSRITIGKSSSKMDMYHSEVVIVSKLKFAIMGCVDMNPVEKIRTPKEKKKEKKYSFNFQSLGKTYSVFFLDKNNYLR